MHAVVTLCRSDEIEEPLCKGMGNVTRRRHTTVAAVLAVATLLAVFLFL